LNLKPSPGNIMKHQNLNLAGMVMQDHLSTLPCYRCPDCQKSNTTIHETQIQWPNILIMTIQRLIHGSGPIIRIKNPFDINRHETLPLSSDGVNPLYKLQALWLHWGHISDHSGHYVCLLPATSSTWFLMNDDKCSV
jgi:hypothetical protein